MIKIICVGKIKEHFYKDACLEYKKRINKWIKINEIEIQEYNYDDINKSLAYEGKEILSKIKKGDYVIAMDINGTKLSSIGFSEKIKKLLTSNNDIVFVIGGSNGLSDEVKNIAKMKLSFSDMTFPHQLFRIMLYEQIYRSLCIINNTKYHK
ncbi:23S rRNA (pseudouridine(1915)-N(3))-methyltransferase RlmH [Caldicellulosiruptoraceae bacterium PP1]